MSELRTLDTVVLLRDLPGLGLRAGDVGAVVHRLGGADYEVEFVMASGRTQALVTLSASDLRAIRDDDPLAVHASISA